jgi:prevent-host-death family protein
LARPHWPRKLGARQPGRASCRHTSISSARSEKPTRLVYTRYTGYMDNTASVREVRENLADVVERATHDELTIITRRGREVAAVVPIEMVREYREWEEERVLRIINERRTAAQPGVPKDQIMTEGLESDE